MRHTVLLIEPQVESRIALGRELGRRGFLTDKAIHMADAFRRLRDRKFGAVVVRLRSNELTFLFAEQVLRSDSSLFRRTVFILDENVAPGDVPMLFRLHPYAVVMEPISGPLYDLVADCIDAQGREVGATRWLHTGHPNWECRKCFGEGYSNGQVCRNLSNDECSVFLAAPAEACDDTCTDDMHSANCMIEATSRRDFTEVWCAMFGEALV